VISPWFYLKPFSWKWNGAIFVDTLSRQGVSDLIQCLNSSRNVKNRIVVRQINVGFELINVRKLLVHLYVMKDLVMRNRKIRSWDLNHFFDSVVFYLQGLTDSEYRMGARPSQAPKRGMVSSTHLQMLVCELFSPGKFFPRCSSYGSFPFWNVFLIDSDETWAHRCWKSRHFFFQIDVGMIVFVLICPENCSRVIEIKNSFWFI